MDKFRKIVWILAELTIVIVIAGVNRKAAPEFMKTDILGLLNVAECLGMFILAPWATLCAWRIFKIYNGPSDSLAAALFIIGAFMLGAGFGMHEPFNAMNARLKLPPELKSLVAYFDDDLGHWIFFIGFGILSMSMAAAETANTSAEPLPRPYFATGVALGIIVAVVIWVNMRNEKTVLDIAVLFAVVAAAEALRLARGAASLRRLPSMIAIHVGYGGGAVATVLYWALS
jgi:hypothetical protein